MFLVVKWWQYNRHCFMYISKVINNLQINKKVEYIKLKTI